MYDCSRLIFAGPGFPAPLRKRVGQAGVHGKAGVRDAQRAAGLEAKLGTQGMYVCFIFCVEVTWVLQIFLKLGIIRR
jgi:hypothetical protein